MIAIKTYTQGKDVLVAACDADLLGKTFEENDFCFTVTKEFYDDLRGDEDLLKKYLARATIANLVGPLVINCTLKMGLITKDNILTIKGVPHAQFIVMNK
jgi:hypothetical protein